VVALMRRGEIWIANLNPNKGGEIGKIRPVLIIQASRLILAGLPTIAILPLTTQFRPDQAPLRVPISRREKLKRDCHVVIEQPRTLDRSRFGDGPLTTLTDAEMASVERSLKAVLGVD